MSEKTGKPTPPPADTVPVTLEDEMRTSYLAYAMSVIVATEFIVVGLLPALVRDTGSPRRYECVCFDGTVAFLPWRSPGYR